MSFNPWNLLRSWLQHSVHGYWSKPILSRSFHEWPHRYSLMGTDLCSIPLIKPKICHQSSVLFRFGLGLFACLCCRKVTGFNGQVRLLTQSKSAISWNLVSFFKIIPLPTHLPLVIAAISFWTSCILTCIGFHFMAGSTLMQHVEAHRNVDLSSP